MYSRLRKPGLNSSSFRQLALERHVVGDELVQEFARARHVQVGRLAALVAVVAGNSGVAVLAKGGVLVGVEGVGSHDTGSAVLSKLPC